MYVYGGICWCSTLGGCPYRSGAAVKVGGNVKELCPIRASISMLAHNIDFYFFLEFFVILLVLLWIRGSALICFLG